MNDGENGKELPNNPRVSALVWVHNLALLGRPIPGDTFIIGPPESGDDTDVPDDLVRLLTHTGEYVAQVRVAGQSQWADNDQVYDNWLAAYTAVATLARRWPAVEATRVVPHDGPEVEALKNEWFGVGRRNPWIANASDPDFTMRSFSPCFTVQELAERLMAHSYAIGAALYYHDLCLIQQVEGGDEWLAIRHGIPFESITVGGYIKSGRFPALVARLLAATHDQCAKSTH
jgi:hypothetical protein